MSINLLTADLSDYDRRLAIHARRTTDVVYGDPECKVGDINQAVAFRIVEALTLAGLRLVASAHGPADSTIGQLAHHLDSERYSETHFGPPSSWEKIHSLEPGDCISLKYGVGLWVPNHTITL